MVLGIQVFGALFGLVLIYLTFLHYKRKEFTLTEWGFWTILALLFATVAVFPQLLDPIVESLSLARTMDLFIILGFMFLIAAVYYTYTIVRGNQKKLEEIVRKIALERKK
jgi:hypothetical protein